MVKNLQASFREKYYVPDVTPIGKGSYAVVYKCLHRETREEFAVKVITKKTAGPNDINNILFEIEVMEAIGYHPYIAHLEEYFETENHLYLVLDLLNGGMLFNHIVELSHYSEKNAAELVRNLLLALKFIHSKGFIHRDLKPENILLRHKRDPQTRDMSYLSDICLADFGLAGKVPSRACCGSPCYIAPEVIKVGFYKTQSQSYNAKCDIWSLGVITYILLSGRMPFSGSSFKETFNRIVSNRWSFSGGVWQSVSPDAMKFIKACLTYNPDDRPSAQELLHHAWIEGVLSDDHLTESVEELRRFNAIQHFRATVRVFCTTRLLLGSIDMTPPFLKYLRHTDKLSTIIEVESQTERSRRHHVDFGLALHHPPGWCLKDCCSCPSKLICRHIQNVNEYLFVGKRSMDIYPFMNELKLIKKEVEQYLKEEPNNKADQERLRKVSFAIDAAYAFSKAFSAISMEQRKPNFMLELSPNSLAKEEETTQSPSPPAANTVSTGITRKLSKLLKRFKHLLN